jgi:TrmH family RNA methyltransferase
MITSTHNPKIQWVRLLQSRSKERREAGVFVVEGVRLAEEALQAGWKAQLVLHSSDLDTRGQAVVSGFAARGTSVEVVAPHVMSAASDTQTPQGLLVVLELASLPIPPQPDLVFIADEVRDPGNLGSMLRSAAAAGCSLACLPEGTADAYSPKVLRAAMGAHFRLPLLAASWQETGERLQRWGLHIYLASAREGIPHTQADLRQRAAIIVGGEAAGAGAAAQQLAHTLVHIPMPGGSESLNAAAAAAILLFEAVRQRQE